MAKYVHRNAYVAINGTALSNYANSLTITDEAEKIDFTGFSANGYREFGQGLRDASIDVTFFQDFASGAVHEILQPLYSSGTTFALEVRPVNATVTATNPKGTMLARLNSYSGFGGKVGDAAELEVKFDNAGTLGLVWGTA
jgi:hypothetical protein